MGNRQILDCPIGCRGADMNTKLDAEQARGLREAGFQFVTRYLSLSTPNPGDLSAGETTAILEAGLGLMAVQHVRFAGWHPSAALGAQDGGSAARQAPVCGLLPGLPLWVDLEEVAATATADDVNAYVEAWVSAVQGAGYGSGAYIGAGLPGNMDEHALWHLAVERYWRSESNVPNVANRGYQLLQLYPQCEVERVFPNAPASVRGIQIDVDITQSDYRGSLPRMLVAA